MTLRLSSECVDISNARANELAKRKLYLLVFVIKEVEGKDVAEFLFKREMEKRDEAHNATYQLALDYLGQW